MESIPKYERLSSEMQSTEGYSKLKSSYYYTGEMSKTMFPAGLLYTWRLLSNRE